MTFNGTMYEEAAAGANERSDVFLTVNDMILMKVYQTTNVKPGTHSGQRTVRYLETRLLGQDIVDGELLQEAVWRFYESWEECRRLGKVDRVTWTDILATLQARPPDDSQLSDLNSDDDDPSSSSGAED